MPVSQLTEVCSEVCVEPNYNLWAPQRTAQDWGLKLIWCKSIQPARPLQQKPATPTENMNETGIPGIPTKNPGSRTLLFHTFSAISYRRHGCRSNTLHYSPRIKHCAGRLPLRSEPIENPISRWMDSKPIIVRVPLFCHLFLSLCTCNSIRGKEAVEKMRQKWCSQLTESKSMTQRHTNKESRKSNTRYGVWRNVTWSRY